MARPETTTLDIVLNAVLEPFIGLPRGQVRREHRREGFEAASADKVFESTHVAQTIRTPRDSRGRLP
jgi:hypothetical protein